MWNLRCERYWTDYKNSSFFLRVYLGARIAKKGATPPYFSLGKSEVLDSLSLASRTCCWSRFFPMICAFAGKQHIGHQNGTYAYYSFRPPHRLFPPKGQGGRVRPPDLSLCARASQGSPRGLTLNPMVKTNEAHFSRSRGNLGLPWAKQEIGCEGTPME